MEELIKTLLEHGSLGVLCAGQLVFIRVLWKKNDALVEKYNKLQEDRIAERDNIVKALDSTSRALSEATELAYARRLNKRGGE